MIQDCQFAALVPEDRSKCIGTTDGGYISTTRPFQPVADSYPRRWIDCSSGHRRSHRSRSQYGR